MHNLSILLLFVVLILLFHTTTIAKNIEPCNDMTKSGPMCLATRKSELSLGSFNSTTSTSIVNALEQHFVLTKSSNDFQKLSIQVYGRSGSQFLPILADKIIKDDCNGASIEGESIRFMNSSSDYMLLSGWFKTIKPVCIGPFKVSDLSTGLVRKVPFIAILSNTTVSSVMNLENDFYDCELASLDIDKNSGNIYVLMQKSSELWLGVYQKDGQLLLKKQFGKCNSPTNCKLVKIHYSNVYDRIVILIKESSKSLTIEGNARSFSESQSAYWFVLLNNVDGAHVHTHRVFHSISTLLAIPKVEFDSIGTSILLFACQDGCYLNDRRVDSNVFLLKYDFIKTNTPIVKNFMMKTNFKNLNISSPIIHSLSLERDLTINAVITGFNDTYVIQDNIDRTIRAIPLSNYLYRFRYSDGKIINLMPLSNGDNFVISSPSSLVDTNPKVTEQSAIFFSTNETNFRVITYQNLGNNHSNEFVVVSKTNFPIHQIGPQFDSKISKIGVCFFDNIEYIHFTGVDGVTVSSGSKSSRCQYFETSIDADELFLNLHQEISDSYLRCIQFTTTKKEFNIGPCFDFDVQITTVPYGLDIVGVNLTSPYLNFNFGYPKTYSCNSGWSGENCVNPSCFGLDSNDINVCGGKSNCTAPNICETCISTESQGKNCQSYGFYCHDSYSPFNDMTCNGGGACQSNGSCNCFTGFYGVDCETPALCYGISKIDKNVCSGNGYCVDTNQCKCNPGYVGLSCEIPVCHGITANSSSVCSSHGFCVSADSCLCKQGYYGSNCEIFTCYGFEKFDSYSVCSKRGSCVDLDTCSCNTGYYGNSCEQTTCKGLPRNDTNVCNGRGECVAWNNCYCTHSSGSNCETCNYGYFGSKCEMWNCDNILANSSNVCTGRGICTAPNSCKCNAYSYGKNCEYCNAGHFGELCNDWTCNGTLNSNDSVCNYRGVCYEVDKCTCNSNSTGTYCEKCKDFKQGKTCSECIEGHYGSDCGYYIENSTIPYISYMENTPWVGFVVNFHASSFEFTKFDQFLGCQEILQDIRKLSSSTAINSVKCRVKKSVQRYLVEVWVFKETAIFDPKDPIMFNIMWPQTWNSNSTKPIYIPLTLDMSLFVQQNSGFLSAGGIKVSNPRKYSHLLNRCFENVFSNGFVQPDHGPIRSITWKLEGDSKSLYNFEIVKNALKNAQNTLSWTLPYFTELKSVKNIELSLTIITNWNLTFHSSADFDLDGSFPRTFVNSIDKPYIVNLKTPTVTIPLSTFFSGNFDCIDGRTMLPAITPNPNVAFEITQDSIILKPKNFKTRLNFSIMFNAGGYIYFFMFIEAPTVFIKETIIPYSKPIFTIECNNIYGKDPDGGSSDVVWVVKGSTPLSRSIYNGPVQMDLSMIYPQYNTGQPLTLTVYCMRIDTQYANTDFNFFSYMSTQNYRSGRSDQVLSFSYKVDESGCKVESVNFKTKIPKLIGFGDTSFDLEIITTKATNCKVDVNIVDSSGVKTMLESVSMPGSTRTLIPIKSQEISLQSPSGKVAIGSQFLVSAMGSGDVSDHSVSMTVQKTPFEREILDCTISPSIIQIGFTEASLVCDTSMVTSKSVIYTLLLDGVNYGSGSSFPIKFKPTKAVKRHRIYGADPSSGGYKELFLYLDNNVVYSSNYLSTVDALESVSIALSNSTDDYYKKNDLVVSMISNINTITNESVLNEMSKLVPLALSATAKSLFTKIEKENVTSLEMGRYINQVKVLSKPQFLNQDSALATLQVLNKFVNVSKDASFWTSNSPQPLTDILLNVASKITEQSFIQTSTSIVNSAISYGTSSELTTSYFYPSEKPSNLVNIRAVKVLDSSLKDFYIGNTSLIAFNILSHSGSIKFQTRDFISYLSLSAMNGSAHVTIPLTTFEESADVSTLRCVITYDNVNFDTENKYCKLVQTSRTQLAITTNSPQNVLLADCLCDLSALSITLGRTDNAVGITVEFVTKTLNNDNEENRTGDLQKGDSSGAAAIILIPIFICCACFVAIPATVVFILVREIKKRKDSNSDSTTPEVRKQQPHPYARVVTSSSIATTSNSSSIEEQNPNNIAMKTFSSFSVTEETPTNATTV